MRTCLVVLGWVVLFLALLLYPGSRWGLIAPEFPVHTSGAVFITGCSSGIGKHAALGLLHEGYDVFATVRKQKDADALMAAVPVELAAKLHPLLCDVTDQKELTKATVDVKAWLSGGKDRVLAGVVNNAGVSSEFALLEHVTQADFDWVLDVNLRAPLAVYRAFLPLLREYGPGRIVNVGSLAGQVARPFRGPYTISKFAVEGLSDTMRMELRLEGISVSMVNPGYVQSAIFSKVDEQNTKSKDKQLSSLQQRMLASFVEKYEKAGSTAPPADVTTEAITHALKAPRPRSRYYPGSCGMGGLSAEFCQRILWLTPDWLRDTMLVKAAAENE